MLLHSLLPFSYKLSKTIDEILPSISSSIGLSHSVFSVLPTHLHNLRLLPPHHLIHNLRIALDDLNHFGTYILLHVIRHRDSIVSFLIHCHCGIHRLQKVQCFGKSSVRTDNECGGAANLKDRIEPTGQDRQLAANDYSLSVGSNPYTSLIER